jgi:Protein of unknown function (DUF5818)
MDAIDEWTRKSSATRLVAHPRTRDRMKPMKHLILSLLAMATLPAAQGKQTFTGTITDNMCANKAGHSQMRMGPTDAECTMACITAHGASYVLYDGKDVYTLSDQKTPEKFAAQRVRVTGTLDAKTKTIQVDSITAAK